MRRSASSYRDGFVVVRDVLTADQVKFLRQGCEREAAEVVAMDPNRDGNRHRNRYSWGGASLTNSVLHREEWVMLVDLPTLNPIITAIFGSSDYHVRRAAGDFCLPGAMYQRLHVDIGDRVGGFSDPRGIALRSAISRVPLVCCNFLAQDFTKINGPTRQIRGTQNSREMIPELDEEPVWMKYSTVCPAPAGSVMIRDIRAWHGGTPNLSNEMRAIPNAVFLAPWFHERQLPAMPREMFDLLVGSTVDGSANRWSPTLLWRPAIRSTPPARRNLPKPGDRSRTRAASSTSIGSAD